MFYVNMDFKSAAMFNGENKYLIVSSLLFLIPGLYGIHNKEYILSCIFIVGSLISINYWRDPQLGFRRNLDLYYVRFSSIYYIISILLLSSFFHQVLIASAFGMGVILFKKSCDEYRKKNAFWYSYHLSFHTICSIAQLMLVHWSIFLPIY